MDVPDIVVNVKVGAVHPVYALFGKIVLIYVAERAVKVIERVAKEKD